MDIIVLSLWFFLPAGLANGAPVIANKIPYLNRFATPVDFGAHFRGRRLLGDNKTWRGVITGVVVAMLTCVIQGHVFSRSLYLQNIFSGTSYSELSPWLIGLLLGVGAIFVGDVMESLIKRLRGIPSGESWFPFDQLDYIAGGLLLSSLVVRLNLEQYVAIVVVWFSLHIISVYISYLLGLKDNPI